MKDEKYIELLDKAKRVVLNHLLYDVVYNGLAVHTYIDDKFRSLLLVKFPTPKHETLITLQVFWPKLVNGGILIIDDYDHWSGSRKAVNEYFGMYRPFLMRMDTGRIAVKLPAD